MRMPYMPFYVGDFLADVSGLSSTEVGAYILLIMAYWSNGGPLPNDREQIRRILRHPKRFAEILSRVSQYFTVTDTHYIHQRIDKELNRYKIAYAKRSLGAHITNALRDAERAQPEPEPSKESKKEDFGFVNNVSQVLRVTTENVTESRPAWTREQKKLAWQDGISREAQRTMPAEKYAAFLEAWLNDDPAAKRIAEAIDKNLKLRKRAS